MATWKLYLWYYLLPCHPPLGCQGRGELVYEDIHGYMIFNLFIVAEFVEVTNVILNGLHDVVHVTLKVFYLGLLSLARIICEVVL